MRLTSLALLAVATFGFIASGQVSAAEQTVAKQKLKGVYLEARTCQVYTGPCFANGEMGLTGKDAIMAWAIDKGTHNGVRLDGLKVIMVVNSQATLGHQGIAGAGEVKSVVLVDEKASVEQQEALIDMARSQAGKAGEAIVRVDRSPIEMDLDRNELTAKLSAGKAVKLETRKARPGDCICSNEAAFYPPLANVTNFVPGVTVDGGFKGRGLGSTWSIPDSRSAYMGLFEY